MKCRPGDEQSAINEQKKKVKEEKKKVGIGGERNPRRKPAAGAPRTTGDESFLA